VEFQTGFERKRFQDGVPRSLPFQAARSIHMDSTLSALRTPRGVMATYGPSSGGTSPAL